MAHPTILPAKTFKLSDADYNDFVAYLSDKDYDYTTKSEKEMEELKATAEKEKYFESVKTDNIYWLSFEKYFQACVDR